MVSVNLRNFIMSFVRITRTNHFCMWLILRCRHDKYGIKIKSIKLLCYHFYLCLYKLSLVQSNLNP